MSLLSVFLSSRWQINSYVRCQCTVSGIALFILFFFQAEDGIRDLVRSRGLGDVYKRQVFGYYIEITHANTRLVPSDYIRKQTLTNAERYITPCLLYTSDAADERSSVDLGGRRIIKKKTNRQQEWGPINQKKDWYYESSYRNRLIYWVYKYIVTVLVSDQNWVGKV